MRNSVGGLTVIMTRLQADTVHAPHRHNDKRTFLMVNYLLLVSHRLNVPSNLIFV